MRTEEGFHKPQSGQALHSPFGPARGFGRLGTGPWHSAGSGSLSSTEVRGIHLTPLPGRGASVTLVINVSPPSVCVCSLWALHTHTHQEAQVCLTEQCAASCFPGLQRSSLWLLFLHTLVWLQNCALTEQPAGLWSHVWTRRWHQTVKVPKSVGFPQGHHRCTPWLSWHPLFTEITEMFRVLLGGFWGRVECKTNFNTGRIDCSPGSLSQCLDGTELVLL